MTTAIAAAITVAFVAALALGFPALMRYRTRRLWRPAGADEAEQVVCAALGIRRPDVFWVRGEAIDPGAVRRIVGEWVPGALTISKDDGQPFSATALAFEAAREARHQLEHIDDVSEPTSIGGDGESARLLELAEKARGALRKWEMG